MTKQERPQESWAPKLPDPPWSSKPTAPSWAPKLPAPPRPPKLPAPPWLLKLPAPPRPPESLDPPWPSEPPDPPWPSESPDPPWSLRVSCSAVDASLVSRSCTGIQGAGPPLPGCTVAARDAPTGRGRYCNVSACPSPRFPYLV
ncbi:uncharacterized protein LOC131523433 [Onychostoma macrolepis]|uniref:uncharacterized protein LOC131523433 n=1 Tax=Onychostoma macrolepis TaxID=369639 RepID=UPI00272A7679|nr:uncharacterized protein LOC131523433 [Onychostoma macrolepis]